MAFLLRQGMAGMAWKVIFLSQGNGGMRRGIVLLRQEMAEMRREIVPLRRENGGMRQEIHPLWQEIAVPWQEKAGIRRKTRPPPPVAGAWEGNRAFGGQKRHSGRVYQKAVATVTVRGRFF